ncbi:MAG: hypothetical protein M0Z28_05925 [Rhodospirillales bacterium]|nr:hypothetical protein [Rhodospirillales bacterium]
MPLIPMTDGPALAAARVHYPSTLESWRWLYRQRRERGVEEAFVRVGRRILVDTDRLLELMRQSGPNGLPAGSSPAEGSSMPALAAHAMPRPTRRRSARPTKAEQLAAARGGAR